MRFPDPNIGYLFGYGSQVTDSGVLVTFLHGRVRVSFPFADMAGISRSAYRGGRVSWDVVRWGKCPRGTEALAISMKKGLFRENLVVFGDLDAAVRRLGEMGIPIR